MKQKEPCGEFRGPAACSSGPDHAACSSGPDHEQTCNCCEESIMGTRFKCTVCPEYQQCSTCQSFGLHKEHPMRTIQQGPEEVDPFTGEFRSLRLEDQTTEATLPQEQKEPCGEFRGPAACSSAPLHDQIMNQPVGVCNCCEESIMGTRFKCTVCPEYQLCSTCQSISSLHKKHPMRTIQVPATRIMLLGKSGVGKSSLANTIFGEDKSFQIGHDPNSEVICKSETRSVHGRNITVVDAPGFFDTSMSEEKQKKEIIRCIVDNAPGPHAFVIVLKVDKYTPQEIEVITQIRELLSAEAFRHAAIVFTHGNQLCEGEKVLDWAHRNEALSYLVSLCGERCHVVDNKYWNNNQQDNYRSNHLQVAGLLDTIGKMVKANNGSCYTSEMLQVVQTEIAMEKDKVRKQSPNMTNEKILRKAKDNVVHKCLIIFAGVAVGAIVGAFFRVLRLVIGGSTCFTSGKVAMLELLPPLLIVAGVFEASQGAVEGGLIGYDVAKEAETPGEAARKAAAKAWNIK